MVSIIINRVYTPPIDNTHTFSLRKWHSVEPYRRESLCKPPLRMKKAWPWFPIDNFIDTIQLL